MDERKPVDDEIRLIEANRPAKEVASAFIGRYGILIIFALVVVGVVAALMLPSEALTPVVGLVSTAVMALIAMLSGITGTKDKEEKPEFKVISNLIERLDQREPPMKVDVENGRVTVTKGHDVVTMKKE